jgi:hypothetical protein
MLHFLKKVLMFRIGQKASARFAKSLGLHALAGVIGVIGGTKYMRRHS